MLTAYCIRRAGEPPPDDELTGIDARPVELFEEATLGAWISEGAPPAPTLERIRDHDAVVRAALRSATPLPLRYGTHFAEASALRDLLRERADEFTRALDRVAGRVEVGLRIVDGGPPLAALSPEPDHPPIRSGRDFLEARRARLERDAERRRQVQELVVLVEGHFSVLHLERVHALAPEPGVLASMAHLVHRAELHRYRHCFEQARAALPTLDLRLTGPWAPYSFV